MLIVFTDVVFRVVMYKCVH